MDTLTKELKAQSTELKTLTENYNSERTLRKKYYNMIEDMKGKIRVYCRVRPLSKSEVTMVCNETIYHWYITVVMMLLHRDLIISQRVLTNTVLMYTAPEG